jgi:uncharacterized protein (DUF305 family)
VLLAALVFAGCGGQLGGAESKPNSTDAAFVRAMIAHERAAGAMARLGTRKALRDELREIARSRLARHERTLPELGRVRTALRSMRVPLAGAAIHTEPPPYSVHSMRAAVSIDHEFLVRMVEQHAYAMRIAELERDHGGDHRIKLMAASIYESSRRDLETLRRWLRTWYGDDTQPGPTPAPSPGGSGSPGDPEV